MGSLKSLVRPDGFRCVDPLVSLYHWIAFLIGKQRETNMVSNKLNDYLSLLSIRQAGRRRDTVITGGVFLVRLEIIKGSIELIENLLLLNAG